MEKFLVIKIYVENVNFNELFEFNEEDKFVM